MNATIEKFDFEDIEDPIEAEQLLGKGNRELDKKIYELQHARSPHLVKQELEEARALFTARMAAWEDYKATRLADWVKNWGKTVQAMNDREGKLDHEIFKALHTLQELCLKRAYAACLRRLSSLKYADVGGLGHEERLAMLNNEVRVNGKTVRPVRMDADALAPDIFQIFTSFVLANWDAPTERSKDA